MLRTAVGTDQEDSAELSIIVLNYKSRTDAVEAAVCAGSACEGVPYELIIVDNASSGDTASAIRERCPQARLICLPENVGFAAGMNAGIREARGEYVLLLNSDVRAAGCSLWLLMDYMKSRADVGLCAPRLVDDSRRESRTLLIEPTVTRVLVPLLGKFAYKRWRSRVGSEPLDVEATEGAAVMVSRHALSSAGMLDEDFFFHYEIVEWCMRLRDCGFAVTVVPKVVMVHACGGSTGRVRRAARIELKRSKYILLAKRFGRVFSGAVQGRDLLGEVLSVAFYGVLCAVSLGFWGRWRRKLAVHWATLLWMATGMPARKSATYVRLFGSWD